MNIGNKSAVKKKKSSTMDFIQIAFVSFDFRVNKTKGVIESPNKDQLPRILIKINFDFIKSMYMNCTSTSYNLYLLVIKQLSRTSDFINTFNWKSSLKP